MNYIMSPRMLKFTKEFENCKHKHPYLTDLRFYESFDNGAKVPYFWCAKCESRWFRDKHYNPDEWDEYVNGDVSEYFRVINS